MICSSVNENPGTPEPSGPPITLNEMLHCEYVALSRLRTSDIEQPSGADATSDQRARNLRQLYKWTAENPPLLALCLSGGGIRSATFNLGVLQGLARAGLLGMFDYLSSVSGGGYIASWLRTWMRRDGTAQVIAQLDGSIASTDPLATEPAPIVSLRKYSNYLTPQLGLLSGDTWSAAAIILRNLILNWLVIIPLLATVIGIPHLFLLVVKAPSLSPLCNQGLFWLALFVEFLASASIYYHRRFSKTRGVSQAYFIFLCVLPIGVAAAALSTAALSVGPAWGDTASPAAAEHRKHALSQFAFAWCVLIPIAGWLVSELFALLPFSSRSGRLGRDTGSQCQRVVSMAFEAFALLVSGAIATVVLTETTLAFFGPLYKTPALYVILVLPALLGQYLFARVLFIGIANLGDGVLGRVRSSSSDDADREWWARLSGWVLLIIVSWIVVTAVCLLGTHLPALFKGAWPKTIKGAIAALGGVSGLAAALTGSGSGTAANRAGPGAEPQKPPLLRRIVIIAAAPVFCVCVIITMSWLTSALGEWATGKPDLFEPPAAMTRDAAVSWITCGLYFLLLVGLTVFAITAGRVVNINRFSLHGMYRNRLVRAYLGASNPTRQPDPFTGFCPDDNLELHDLWHSEKDSAQTGNMKAERPLPIINTTLNLVQGGDELAWQERKAESFCMTPFYCGNWREGYRRSCEYGGFDGITVGTAISISGAAANPNMGYCSSPALGFLMAVFNVRLGAWLGNTNSHGNHTYRFPGPRQAIMPLFSEMFGLTNATRRYVNLSDGGHFDNLGLYEVVLRRCRQIIVSDAGQDASFAFDDLGNAIRKIRIDLGVPIEFEKRIEILPNLPEDQGMYCALAVIRYSQVDGGDPARDGHLVYFKPILQGHGTVPIPEDVYSYSRSHEKFPHESTANQWFSESQFESYRALGVHAVSQVSGSERHQDFDTFLRSVREYLKLS